MRGRISVFAILSLIASLLVPPSPVDAVQRCPRFWKQRYRIDAETTSVGVAELTGDKRPDIALVTTARRDERLSNKLIVYRQRRGGAFVRHQMRETSGYSSSERKLDVGDIDGDRRADVVVTTNRGPQIFYQGHAGLRKGQHLRTRFITTDVVVSDLNHDGRRDPLVETNGLRIFYNRGDRFKRVKITSKTGWDYAIGNIYGRRRKDIVALRDKASLLFAQRQDGSFRRAQAVDTNDHSTALDIADVTGDGILDLLTGDYGRVDIHRGRRRAGVRQRSDLYRTQDGGYAVLAGRFNDDARKDVVQIHGGWDYFGVLLQKRDGTLQKECFYGAPTPTHAWGWGSVSKDLNKDGKSDLVYANATGGFVVAITK